MTDVMPESAGPLAAHVKNYLAHKRGLGKPLPRDRGEDITVTGAIFPRSSPR